MSAEMREAGPDGARPTVRRLDVGRAAAATCARTMTQRLPHKTSHADFFSAWRQSRSRFSKAGGWGRDSVRSLARTLNTEH